ncbi:MAG: hypothetical protein ACLUN6_03945 [Holdemanella sp.]|uniref:hypothetical protein n=1 Tax=Holdemanella sp. TaxID=1971762 RepID=UPI003993132B
MSVLRLYGFGGTDAFILFGSAGRAKKIKRRNENEEKNTAPQPASGFDNASAFVPASAQAVDETPYDLRVSTFEDADYKGGANFAGGSDWTSLIDDPQYGGPLLYGSSGAGVTTESEAYKWTDENNTMLSHVFPYNYNAYCYWGGGHAISNYGTGDIADYGGFQTQLTVYKKGVSGLTRTGAGHNGSDNFAVHYGYIDGSQYNKTEVLPAFSLYRRR